MLPLTKTIIYPTTLVYDVGHDLLWSAAINLVAESLIILSVMLLSKKTDKTLFELVENTFGNVGARIVYGCSPYSLSSPPPCRSWSRKVSF